MLEKFENKLLEARFKDFNFVIIFLFRCLVLVINLINYNSLFLLITRTRHLNKKIMTKLKSFIVLF